MPPVLHSLWIAVWVLIAVASFGVAFLGMVGLTRASYRLATRHGWKEPRPTAFTMATGLVAFLGGWLIYVCWWPLARLFRPWPRLRIIGPALGACLLIVGGGVTLATVGGPCAFDPPPGDFSDVTITNDGSGAVVLGLCDNDKCSQIDRPVHVVPGSRRTFNIESCSGGPIAVTAPVERRLLGCIWISEPKDDNFSDLPPARVSQMRSCGRDSASVVVYNNN